MTWNQSTSGASQTIAFAGDAQSLPQETVLKEMWEFVVTDILPLNSNVSWDFVKVELWADSGRIIVFPASSQGKFRIEKAVCQVFLPSLLEESELLDGEFSDEDGDLEDEDDEAFDQAAAEMEMRWIDAVEAAAQSQIEGKAELSIRFYSADGDEPVRVIEL